METYRQRIGYNVEESVGVFLHFKLLAANVNRKRLSVRRFVVEINAVVAVGARKLGTRNVGFGSACVLNQFVDVAERVSVLCHSHKRHNGGNC